MTVENRRTQYVFVSKGQCLPNAPGSNLGSRQTHGRNSPAGPVLAATRFCDYPEALAAFSGLKERRRTGGNRGRAAVAVRLLPGMLRGPWDDGESRQGKPSSSVRHRPSGDVQQGRFLEAKPNNPRLQEPRRQREPPRAHGTIHLTHRFYERSPATKGSAIGFETPVPTRIRPWIFLPEGVRWRASPDHGMDLAPSRSHASAGEDRAVHHAHLPVIQDHRQGIARAGE